MFGLQEFVQLFRTVHRQLTGVVLAHVSRGFVVLAFQSTENTELVIQEVTRGSVRQDQHFVRHELGVDTAQQLFRVFRTPITSNNYLEKQNIPIDHRQITAYFIQNYLTTAKQLLGLCCMQV